MMSLDQPTRDNSFAVIPAKAGIQYSTADSGVYWIPACAGMTLSEAMRENPSHVIVLERQSGTGWFEWR
jgi:hypothetical protein